MLNFVKIKRTRKNILRPLKFNGNVHTSVKVIFSTIIINPQEGGIYKCHKSAHQATTGHARMQPAWGREIMRRNHFFKWRLNPIRDSNNELMTWQDFLPKGNGIQKSKMSLRTRQVLVQNKIPFAQCVQLLLILVTGVDWSLRLKWLRIWSFYIKTGCMILCSIF